MTLNGWGDLGMFWDTRYRKQELSNNLLFCVAGWTLILEDCFVTQLTQLCHFFFTCLLKINCRKIAICILNALRDTWMESIAFFKQTNYEKVEYLSHRGP